ncbi:translesion error-prone DNA polymerase V autoproteolytic subunit [Ancylomarina salipaludis]|uniref:Translesion error-prone DNA polymerase V autoproteolytic subunit n=1 Tax=Ancylomarina salipaludis TaxID=2501299 RepID=A0A4Q1JJU2_9BACT|nr:translesion error-prone DNA polymerase V autoproteolytic subunit [Ancylomarina salipaludis]RXQ91553.1 translesion error-prone DNA polymerase V autoproteolytic subunit [Ancylomarina salipaludis]
MTKESKLQFFIPSSKEKLLLPFVSAKVRAGFPSPADDFIETKISLDKELIKNKEATFYVRVEGSSMIGANIHDGDLLVIDRSLEPSNNKIAVCFIDGEFTVKRLRIEKDHILLMPENEKFEPIKVTSDNDFLIWGVVTYIIKAV